jgi:hypothetical protein
MQTACQSVRQAEQLGGESILRFVMDEIGFWLYAELTLTARALFRPGDGLTRLTPARSRSKSRYLCPVNLGDGRSASM